MGEEAAGRRGRGRDGENKGCQQGEEMSEGEQTLMRKIGLFSRERGKGRCHDRGRKNGEHI